MNKKLAAAILVLALAAPMTACTNMNKTQQGALSAGVGGAAVGAGIGALTGGSAGIGAAIGGAAGAIAGGIYGHNKDK